MTREEKLQQFAEQNTKGLYLDRHNLIQMVKQGAAWADSHPRWIPVEERLPEERKVVWVRKHFNKEILGEFDIYDSAAFCNGEFQCDNSGNITHWMEIMPPRKEDKND